MHVHKQVIVDRLQGATNPPTGPDGRPAAPTVTGAAAHQPELAPQPLSPEELAAIKALEETPADAAPPLVPTSSSTEPAGGSDSDDRPARPGVRKAR